MSVSPTTENVEQQRQPTLRLRVKEKPQGILRLDINAAKPRRNSVEFRTPTEIDLPSPQTSSIDHLSVTFAPEERSMCSDTSVKVNMPSPTSPAPMLALTKSSMNSSDRLPAPDPDVSEDDDYSASVNAVIMRRASTRKSRRRSIRRRTSSPFSPDVESLYSESRRRSSVYTNSSGETVISVDETTGSEEMYELLKLHKEVLSAVRTQPWPMRRKLRLVQLAHAYVKQHEGALHQRLAASHNTRDVVKRYRLLANKKLQYIKRELANLSKYLTPWEMRIKQIESQFGSVVASYFTFLRWLLWVNLVIAVTLISFVTIPEVLTADWKNSGDRKEMLDDEKKRSGDLVTLVNFEGILKYSPLFYGYYSNRNGTGGYRLPLAYFITGLVVYVYSFIATLRKMAANSRLSKMSEKEDECVFTWKIFTGWDYMIGNPETAQNRVSSLVLGFKEALLEEAEKKREERNWRIIVSRVFVNFIVLILLAISAFVVIWVVQRSSEPGAEMSWWRKNEINICLSLISSIFPIFFEILGLLEYYHPRKQLRIQLARIMLLNLLNLYSLIIALFDKIGDMTKQLQALKVNSTIANSLSILTTSIPNTTSEIIYTLPELFTNPTTFNNNTDTSTPNETSSIIPTICHEILVNCSELAQNVTTVITTLLLTSAVTSPTTPFYSPNVTFYPTDFNWFNNTPTPKFSSPIQNVTDPNLNTTMTNISNIYMNLERNETNDPLEMNLLENFFLNELYDPNIEQVLYDVLNDEPVEDKNITEKEPRGLLNSTNNNIFTTTSSFFDHINDTITHKYGMKSNNNYTTPGPDLCVIKTCNNSTDESSISASKLVQDTRNMRQPSVQSSTEDKYLLDIRKKIRNLCWETSFGQEIVKLTVTDLVFTIVSTLLVDFFRALFVRYMNNCWCWDLEKNFPQYGDFKIAENILHLVNNQGMVWMGMFFSPGLVVINLIKLIIMMYLRSWTVLTCNVPHEIVFRASRSNNFYFALLLTMLFLCVLPVGYAIVWVKPSHHCGPFSGYATISKMFTEYLHEILPEKFHQVLDYIASPGIVIPLLVLLILIIYYLMSLSNALREANHDLKAQLRKERTEERRKMFQIADKRYKTNSSFDNTPYGKWKKLFSNMAVTKQNSQDACPQVAGSDLSEKQYDDKTDQKAENKKREIMARIMKNAFGMQSIQTEDDGTDTELHDSLPEDAKMKAEITGEQNMKKLKETNNKPQGTREKRNQDKKQQMKQQRQSSDLSVWSDNIPVITISKTESSESILDNKNNVKISKPEEFRIISPEIASVHNINENQKLSECNLDHKQTKQKENTNLLRKLFKSTPKLLKFQVKQESDEQEYENEHNKKLDEKSTMPNDMIPSAFEAKIETVDGKYMESPPSLVEPLMEIDCLTDQNKILPENDDIVSNLTKTESSSDYKE